MNIKIGGLEILTYLAMFSFASKDNESAARLIKILRYESQYSKHLDDIARDLIGRECDALYQKLSKETQQWSRIN